jgi:hypothetical protein
MLGAYYHLEDATVEEKYNFVMMRMMQKKTKHPIFLSLIYRVIHE